MYYTLTFTHTFAHSNDICYFSMCYPYTYTDLNHYLYSLQCSPQKAPRMKREVLCKTLAGNNCDLLTITEPGCKSSELVNKRLGVVITARVHPGESNASYIMHGIIEYLLSDEATSLRKKFVFKIVPMLNPDGVINGNYRTSLAGIDLNRRWNNPDQDMHPTIYYTKQMVKKFCRTRQVVLQCDIHGHSRKEGLFVYGCVSDNSWERYIKERDEEKRLAGLKREVEEKKEKEKEGKEMVVAFNGGVVKKDYDKGGGVTTNYSSNSTTNYATNYTANNNGANDNKNSEREDGNNATEISVPDNLHSKLRARMFPRIYSTRCPSFIFNGCSFRLQKSKATTMRIVMYEELGIVCSYTLEASFAGLNGQHFTEDDLKGMGTDFCTSLGDFADFLELENQHQTILSSKSPTAAKSNMVDLEASGDWNDESSQVSAPAYAFPVGDDDGDGDRGIEEDSSPSFVKEPRDFNDGGAVSPFFESVMHSITGKGSPKSHPLADILKQEMAFLNIGGANATSNGGDEGNVYESAGSDSDPSGDNLNEKELRKKFLAGKKTKKKVKKKKVTSGGGGARARRATSDFAASSSSSTAKKREQRDSAEANLLRSSAVSTRRVSTPTMPKMAAVNLAQPTPGIVPQLPTRPKAPIIGKSPARRIFGEGRYSDVAYSKTPRAMQSSSGTATPSGESGAFFNNRAQSAGAVERNSGGLPPRRGTDPRFVVEQGSVRDMTGQGGEGCGGGGDNFIGFVGESRRKLSSVGSGIVRGSTRSARSSFQEKKSRGHGIGVGVQGNGTGFVSTNELKAALAREAQLIERDLSKNLDLKIGKL
jgi:hypothetical protein